MADHRITKPKIRLEEIRQHLCSVRAPASTRKAFQSISSKVDPWELVRRLYEVVYCCDQIGKSGRKQAIKADLLVLKFAGITRRNLRNYPAKIRGFADELKSRMDKNISVEMMVANDNTHRYRDVIPTLYGLADLFESSTELYSSEAQYRREAYPDALRRLAQFIQDETGKARYPSLEKLLAETANFLGFTTQSYEEKTLREIVQYYRSKKVRNQGK